MHWGDKRGPAETRPRVPCAGTVPAAEHRTFPRLLPQDKERQLHQEHRDTLHSPRAVSCQGMGLENPLTRVSPQDVPLTSTSTGTGAREEPSPEPNRAAAPNATDLELII